VTFLKQELAMKSEVFYYDTQESIATYVVSNLRYLGYSVTKQLVSSSSVELARRFIKLLQAAIPPERGMQLNFVEHDFASYWFYFRMYFQMTGAIRSFQGGTLDSFFPAVAIGERMVLVPKGLEKILSNERDNLPCFCPFDPNDVSAIDFKEESAILATIAKIDKAIREELRKELNAYARYYGPVGEGILQVSRDLGVEPAFLRRTLEGGGDRRNVYSELSCEVAQPDLRCRRWTKVELKIKNGSDQRLIGLIAAIKGPVRVLPTRIEVDIEPNSTNRIWISLMPQEPGDFPLEIIFSLPSDRAFTEWLPVCHVWLHCE
jgi:hypothetical protein